MLFYYTTLWKGYGRKVVFAGAQGAEEKVQRERFLGLTGLTAGGFLSLTGPLAPRVVDCPSGNAYKVSVTSLPYCVIWLNKHSADWLAALATPYPGCAGLPPQVGQNKANA